MRQLFTSFLIIFLFVISTKISAQTVAYLPAEKTKERKKASSLEWKTTEYDLGNIPQGVPVAVDFTFTNRSSQSIVITHVTVGCGCTATEFLREPVAPGKSSKISVRYNAAHPGIFRKTITVIDTSPEGGKVLYIKGNVVEKK